MSNRKKLKMVSSISANAGVADLGYSSDDMNRLESAGVIKTL